MELNQGKIRVLGQLIIRGRKSLNQVEEDYREAVEVYLLEQGFYDEKK
ncbi:MAG: CD1375 family protein [Oscillospiraceae bacterium]